MQLEGFEQAAIELKAEIDALIAKYEKRLKTRIRAAYSPDWDAYVWVWSAGLHKALLGKDDEHIKVVRMTPETDEKFDNYFGSYLKQNKRSEK